VDDEAADEPRSEAADGAPVSDQSPMKRLRPGDAGVVESLCRPVGKARFGNDLMDVVCEGGTLAPGTRVRVLRRDGNRVVVEKAQG
ncbi:MAG TPA: NfeD family protein, partial [Phycisphaerae bacterium]|nr:NfeD family protein [Phycisphaerae bacterium]